MRVKSAGVLLVVALTLGMMSVPVSAEESAGPHVGVFQGVADVGKFGSCNDQGLGEVTGGGIGLLPIPVKNAWWKITAGLVIDVPNGLGVADLCGRLTAPLQGTAGQDLKDIDVDLPDPLPDQSTGIGASCAATKGWGGYGKAYFAEQVIGITNLGWKVTVGGTFIVTGDAADVTSSPKGKKQDLLIAEVQALSDGVLLGCLNKQEDKTGSDPEPFTVAAVYQIIQGAGCEKTDCDKKDPKKPSEG